MLWGGASGSHASKRTLLHRTVVSIKWIVDGELLAAMASCRQADSAPLNGSRTAIGVPGAAASRLFNTTVIATVMFVEPSFVPSFKTMRDGFGEKTRGTPFHS